MSFLFERYNMLFTYTAIVFLFLTRTFGKEFTMEAENNRTMGNHRVLPYRNATNHKAVYVTSAIPFSINFCIRQKSFVILKDIRFLNFDKNVLIAVTINDRLSYGKYLAYANRNKSGIFRNTGEFKMHHELEAGWNVLKLRFSALPIALDTFVLDIIDNKMNYPIFNCEVVCKQQSSFPVKIKQLVSVASMTQNSFKTKCAEVDNIDVPIYHQNVQAFSITATLPQYKSFANRRSANLTNCPHLSQNLWRFDSFTVTPDAMELTDKSTFLTFHSINSSSMGTTLIFRLPGQSSGSIDTDMGSRLFLSFKSLRRDVNVLMRFKHKNGSMVDAGTKQFNAKNLQQMWTIPDFTWIEQDYNYISLYFSTHLPLKFLIQNLRLDRRPFIPDKTVTLYKSDDIIIEGVLVDMWWRGHERMAIHLSNGKSFEGFAFFRLYRPIPWTSGYCQVCIIYQDGNARFVPVSPEGLDWIPFGTSVILGKIKRASKRPYVSISRVDIIPEEWKLTIFYKDGGSLRMKLLLSDDYTKAYFDNINFKEDTYLFPFATVRSMYVEEGNTDVDSVKVDDVTTYNIMDNWGIVAGKAFAFHRRCTSRHLTLSPDIQIDILKTGSDVYSKQRVIRNHVRYIGNMH